MPQLTLDWTAAGAAPGFRLHRFEVFNWGTFDGRVWELPLDGENGLLTGDIGSGKSTLVDGLTTLLVPAHRVVYNRAAGAEGKERSLASYVRGHYKSAKDELDQGARAVALREQDTYSVLLARFENAALHEGVTLAQVYWMQDHQSQPERFFVVAGADLTIAGAFDLRGGDMKELKKRLRARDAQLFDAFQPYGAEFRRRMGLAGEQALALFYQTVSMKSVGNLTEFIRQHMLEPTDALARIDELRRDFENVNRAYEAVRKAKDQVDRLTPLVADCDRRDAEAAARDALVEGREALAAYFAGQEAELLAERATKQARELEKLTATLAALDAELTALDRERSDLTRAIDDQGGRRLDEIREETTRLTRERDRLQAEAERYRRACEAVGLPFPSDAEAFAGLRAEVGDLLGAVEGELAALETSAVEAKIAVRDLRAQHDQLGAEIASLRARRSNIPLDALRVRTQLCETLGLAEGELPFAGELIRVREEDAAWEGAAERVLHSFALSLLVPEALYGQVAAYVDRTHLRGRLVYYRVPARAADAPAWPADPRALAHKLETKHDHPCAAWLDEQLAHRGQHVCTADLDEFRRLPRALTPQGQMKADGSRHEKDDRHRIDDRTRYVLGWTNHEKIVALEAEAATLAAQGAALLAEAQRLDAAKAALTRRRDGLLAVAHYEDHAHIHWQPLARRIAELAEEKAALEAGSDALRVLEARLREVDDRREATIATEREKRDERGRLAERLASTHAKREQALVLAATFAEHDRARLTPLLVAWQAEALGGKALTVESAEGAQRDVRTWLQARINAAAKVVSRLDEAIVNAMADFKHRYPPETAELDARVEAAPEFRALLSTLVDEDLPRHEAAFKAMLNERTIQGVAMFHNWLEKAYHEIEEKIATINRSLRTIPYNEGTYIQLVDERSQDVEVRDFRRDLRECLGGTLAGDEDALYAEHKFEQVKRLIDRFKGREGLTEHDERWTKKVVDVRNWFRFGASERWAEDDVEREYYEDSAGKSGGQKEKLAYTILASALAFQYGLERGGARAFRFVMIDEAFGRGSDESARYGLELFGRLGLQLLVVTPLQKIHVIEAFVSTVHLVHNPDGRKSQVQTLTIEAYREGKAAATEPAQA